MSHLIVVRVQRKLVPPLFEDGLPSLVDILFQLALSLNFGVILGQRVEIVP